MDIAERFWVKVDKTPTCWVWLGGTNGLGYGQFSVNGRMVYVHRWAYEQVNGPVPDGLELDHLCRNPPCVRPSHLEAVTRQENVRRGVGLAAQNARKTHCPHGHPYAGDNLYVKPNGARACRTCRKEYDLRPGTSARKHQRYKERYARLKQP